MTPRSSSCATTASRSTRSPASGGCVTGTACSTSSPPRVRCCAEFTENFAKNTANLKSAELTAQVTETPDAYDVQLGIDAGNATEAQVREAVATGRGYVEDGKNIYLIDADRLEKIGAVHRALAADANDAGGASRKHRVVKARAAEVNDLLESIAWAKPSKPSRSWPPPAPHASDSSNVRPTSSPAPPRWWKTGAARPRASRRT
jgi:hypothetical protein